MWRLLAGHCPPQGRVVQLHRRPRENSGRKRVVNRLATFQCYNVSLTRGIRFSGARQIPFTPCQPPSDLLDTARRGVPAQLAARLRALFGKHGGQDRIPYRTSQQGVG